MHLELKYFNKWNSIKISTVKVLCHSNFQIQQLPVPSLFKRIILYVYREKPTCNKGRWWEHLKEHQRSKTVKDTQFTISNKDYKFFRVTWKTSPSSASFYKPISLSQTLQVMIITLSLIRDYVNLRIACSFCLGA